MATNAHFNPGDDDFTADTIRSTEDSFDFDIDSILSEFTSSAPEGLASPSTAREAEAASRSPAQEAEAAAARSSSAKDRTADFTVGSALTAEDDTSENLTTALPRRASASKRRAVKDPTAVFETAPVREPTAVYETVPSVRKAKAAAPEAEEAPARRASAADAAGEPESRRSRSLRHGVAAVAQRKTHKEATSPATEEAAANNELPDESSGQAADQTQRRKPLFSRKGKQDSDRSSSSANDRRPGKESRPAKEEKPPKEPKEKKPRKEKKERISFASRMPRGLIKTVSILLVMASLAFVLDFVNPSGTSAASSKTADKALDLAGSVNSYATQKARNASLREVYETEEAVEEAEAEITKTVYVIPDDATVAPEALSTGFGKVPVSDASQLEEVIAQARASGLLGEDESVVFDPNVEFNTGSYYQDIQYYIDDTLLVIAWKEIIDGNTCTFCEVKMQDGSQFRRKLAGDTFGSDILEYTTTMHAETNAVVSMNADYYRFRDMGIVVYDHQLYRFNESDYLLRYQQMLHKYNCIDTLFVTSGGNFLFWHLYEESTPEAMQQFIDDNDIAFSIAFGPILVENGELNTSYFDEQWYPIGEIDTGYSRAGIGQLGEYHYLYMSLNHSDEKSARWTMKEFAQHFYEKGVVNAYALDGGQTSEIVFQGDEAYNHVDHVNGTSSRQVSDMIYFASAINGEEVTK